MKNGWCSMRERRGVPRGMTLVEVLTVIAILGVLFSLAFLALGRSRELARQNQCKNSLRQIGLATTNYVSSSQKLPFSRGAEGFMGLLPWLEENVLYERLRKTYGPGGFDDSTENIHEVPQLFLCPTDTARAIGANYLPCGGRREENYPKHRGFASRGVTSLREITDGLSNTLFYSERLLTHHMPDPFEDRYRWLLSIYQHIETESEFDELCLALYARDAEVRLGTGQITSMAQFNTFGTVYPPNSPSCGLASSGMAPYELGYLRVYTANSLHPQCVSVAFGDGAISTVSNFVSPSVWTAQGTIAGRD